MATFTGIGIDLYRLMTLRSALTLEIKSGGQMKALRGGALKPAKAITGLRTNDRAAHLASVEVMIANLKLELKPGDVVA